MLGQGHRAPSWLNTAFTRENCTVACLTSRERSLRAHEPPGVRPDKDRLHQPAGHHPNVSTGISGIASRRADALNLHPFGNLLPIVENRRRRRQADGPERLDPSAVPPTLLISAQRDHVIGEHLTELGGGNRLALLIRQRVRVWTDPEVDYDYCPLPVSRVDRSARPDDFRAAIPGVALTAEAPGIALPTSLQQGRLRLQLAR